MLNVALTGNIAAGKSTVLSLFRRWGATVIDADELVREAQAPGNPVLHAMVRRFGEDILLPDGSLDRAALRRKVLDDPVALSTLNALVHPAVRRRRESLVDAAWKRGDRIVVNDIPLLFEALDPDQFDVIVLVDAPPPVRQARLEGLRGLSREEAAGMIAAQMPSERKRHRRHLVIDNDSTLEDLERAARAAFDELERRASAKEQS